MKNSVSLLFISIFWTFSAYNTGLPCNPAMSYYQPDITVPVIVILPNDVQLHQSDYLYGIIYGIEVQQFILLWQKLLWWRLLTDIKIDAFEIENKKLVLVKILFRYWGYFHQSYTRTRSMHWSWYLLLQTRHSSFYIPVGNKAKVSSLIPVENQVKESLLAHSMRSVHD